MGSKPTLRTIHRGVEVAWERNMIDGLSPASPKNWSRSVGSLRSCKARNCSCLKRDTGGFGTLPCGFQNGIFMVWLVVAVIYYTL